MISAITESITELANKTGSIVKLLLNLEYHRIDSHLTEILFLGEKRMFTWGKHCQRIANVWNHLHKRSLLLLPDASKVSKKF